MSDTEPAAAALRQLPVRDLRARSRRRAPAAAARGVDARKTRARERLSPRGVRLRRRAAPARSARCAPTCAAFERWRIVPRMLRDVSARDLRRHACSARELPAPLLLAPIGVQSIVHPEAELATGRAAAARRASRSSSARPRRTRSSRSPRRRATASRWYQLYWPKDRELAASFVARADAGRLRRDRRDARHVDARLAPARSAERLPAVPQRRGRRQLLQRPGLPRGAGEAAGGGPRAGDRPLGLPVLQPDA